MHVAPPGVPEDRLKTLREAFSKALSDPELIEEGKKLRMTPDPIPAEELQRIATEVMKASPETVARIKALLFPEAGG